MYICNTIRRSVNWKLSRNPLLTRKLKPLFLATTLFLLVGCTNHTEVESGSYLSTTSYDYSCEGFSGLTTYTPISSRDYAINQDADPEFYIGVKYTDPGPFEVGAGVSILADMRRAGPCRRYHSIFIESDDNEAIELFGVDNWWTLAGQQAIDELTSLQRSCELLSQQEAIAQFGQPASLPLNENSGELPDISEFCALAVQANVYAIRVRGPDGEFIVSNVMGELFFEEI